MGRGTVAMDTRAALATALSIPAASGQEQRLVPLLQELGAERGFTTEEDAAGNILWRRPARSGGLRLLLAAHVDQVALWVTEVRGDGAVPFAAPGIDPRVLPGVAVTHGDLIGVVGFVPPHLASEEERRRPPELSSLTVDFGLLKPPVAVGDPLLFATPSRPLGRHRWCAPGLDNRASLAALLLATDGLAVADDLDVTVAFTVEEEAHRLGAAALARTCPSEVAIVLDVTFGKTAGDKSDATFPLGLGPALGIGPNSDPVLARRLAKLADAERLPYQWEVLPGDSGTDAWALQNGGAGTRTVTLSIPIRYMHSPGEVVDLRDVEATARLLALLLARPTTLLQEVAR
jgi:putative aminopeptidase FrvX